MFKKAKETEQAVPVEVEEENVSVVSEPVDEDENCVEVTPDGKKKVSAGKQTLGFLAFIVIIAGAITMVVNFGLGFSAKSSSPVNWVDLVPIILSAVIAIFTYIVLCVSAMSFVKNKGKGVKITYWISTVVAYLFIIIPVIIDIVSVVNLNNGK